MLKDRFSQLVSEGFEYILKKRNGIAWGISDKKPDVRTTDHVLRLITQLSSISEYDEIVEFLLDAVNSDWGWGVFPHDEMSLISTTTATIYILQEANSQLRSEKIEDLLKKSLQSLRKYQNPNGFWTQNIPRSLQFAKDDIYDNEVRMGCVDLTSVALIAIWKTRLIWMKDLPHLLDSLRRGTFWLFSIQKSDGSWEDIGKSRTKAGATADALRGLTFSVDLFKDNLLKGVQYLLETQNIRGFWDNMDIDHTCDALRALIRLYPYFSRAIPLLSVKRGISWLEQIRNVDHGWSRFPGNESNVNDTCDALSTLLEYEGLVK